MCLYFLISDHSAFYWSILRLFENNFEVLFFKVLWRSFWGPKMPGLASVTRRSVQMPHMPLMVSRPLLLQGEDWGMEGEEHDDEMQVEWVERDGVIFFVTIWKELIYHPKLDPYDS